MYVKMASRKRLDRVLDRRSSIHEAAERDSGLGFGGFLVELSGVGIVGGIMVVG